MGFDGEVAAISCGEVDLNSSDSPQLALPLKGLLMTVTWRPPEELYVYSEVVVGLLTNSGGATGKQLLKTDPSPRPLLCTRRSCALANYPRDTLRKIMLGNTKVNRMSVNDPSKFTKYPMEGKAAVTSVFPEKRNARREIRYCTKAAENLANFASSDLIISVFVGFSYKGNKGWLLRQVSSLAMNP
ncbi:hypothetical protein RJ640_011326 [Escallonia rubra]|uniref:Uncharacterized protein n=1 Tax=Escallonia rubra TaxID=112253 RepID=A0AA88U7Q0_9ASTE|nr:hypothetical protein RJ640_011326 [Escallonia rubra]